MSWFVIQMCYTLKYVRTYLHEMNLGKSEFIEKDLVNPSSPYKADTHHHGLMT